MKHRFVLFRRVTLLLLPAITTSSLASAAAVIQKNAQSRQELPQVTVTAEKTEQTLQSVPVSVVVLQGEELEHEGITGVAKLEARIPGLSFQPFGQAGLNSPVMRGLTANFNTFSTSTLLQVDGVPTLTAQGFEDALLDIDRIEVLRGPQSTLYGRNAEAGVIAIHTLPMDNSRRSLFSAQAGNRNKRSLSFTHSQPLVDDKLYASVAGSWRKQDGFIDNTTTGNTEDDRESNYWKAGLRWTPGTATDIVLRYQQQDYDDGATLWGSPSAPRAQVASGTESWNRSEGQSLSLNVSHTLTSGIRLKSVTALSDVKDEIQQDTDFTSFDSLWIARDHRLRTISQEIRFAGEWKEAEWQIGLYGDASDNDLHNISKSLLTMEDNRVNQESQTLALFTHWRLPLTTDWTLSLGARIENNSVDIKPEVTSAQSQDWTHVSPKVALQYQLMPDHQVYASISRGIRTGGFNVLSASSNFAGYDPETNWSFETGAKGMFFNHRVRYSLAAYWMDIDDMQVMQMPSPGVMYITSAATATSKGIEMDIDFLLHSNWRLQAGIALNRTTFDQLIDGSSDYYGNSNPFSPEVTGHLGLRYESSNRWYAQANLVGTSNVYLDAANQYQRDGYTLLNLNVGWRNNTWDLSVYGSNLADTTYDAVGYQNGYVTVYSPPRELGVRVDWHF